jgi:hypothetical protein
VIIYGSGAQSRIAGARAPMELVHFQPGQKTPWMATKRRRWPRAQQRRGHPHRSDDHVPPAAPPSLLGTAPPACALTRASSPSRRRRPQHKSRPWPPTRSSATIRLPKMCRCSPAAGPSLRALLLPMVSPPVAVDALEVISSWAIEGNGDLWWCGERR